MKLSWSALAALLAALLTSLLTSPVRSAAVSFVSIQKNDGAHGQSSTSYGVQHGPPGQDAAHVEVVQTNKLGDFTTHSRLQQAPLQGPAGPYPGLSGGPHLGPSGVDGGPLGLSGVNTAGVFGQLAGPVGLRGPGGRGGLVGPGGPVGARLVHPGGPLDGPLDGPGPFDGPVGPAGLFGSGSELVRLRNDPSNRVGVNGRAPVQDSFPRPALRTFTGTPVWVPSYSKDPPSYEK